MSTDISTLSGVEIVFTDTLLVPVDKTISRVFSPGDTLTLTSLILDASVDDEGNSFWSSIDDNADQTARWGTPAFRRA